MKFLITTFCLFFSYFLFAQSASIKGQLQEPDGAAVSFANVALYNHSDSSLVKVEVTDANGVFRIQNLAAANYYLVSTYVGYADLVKNNLQLTANQQLDLGVLTFATTSIELATATVTTDRAMVEVKADRTVFNVQGTINSTGSDGVELLRKAPGVVLDNNENITVLGRSGVLVYVDGKRLPLTGDDLSNYLRNLPAEQIDRIDIITTPGAKYEAEGNAGIIDIRLKKDENHGANGSANMTARQGREFRFNTGLGGNFRNKKLNTFGQLGYFNNTFINDLDFIQSQNTIRLDAVNDHLTERQGYNLRVGTDFFLAKNHTLGVLISAQENDGSKMESNRSLLSTIANPNQIDSILVADNVAQRNIKQQTYNLNYRFANQSGRSLNIDLDYGNYTRTRTLFQPNFYFDPTETQLLTENIDQFITPSDIDIYTAKVDYEEELLGGKLGTGAKFSKVVSDNTFLVFDDENGTFVQDNRRSNEFVYDENVFAAYFSFSRKLNKKISFSTGLRAEQTNAMGNLTAFATDLNEPPVELNYLNWFPSAGIRWQANKKNTLALNYSRRINRPEYNILNPFTEQLSELSYKRGNPFLQPEIVNNVELGYTYASRFNFKLAYSYTTDQITRLVVPNTDIDSRSASLTWENLAEQHLYSFNATLPFKVTDWWNAMINFNASYINNQADFGGEATVDIQAFAYGFYQQQTFTLPQGLKFEISGWYNGPGVWGGVFESDPNWSLNFGLQRKFLKNKLNARLAVNDVFFQAPWSGTSNFNGLFMQARGTWDSRFVSLSLGYNFGNRKVKSRKRKTGLEDEAGRTKEQ
ncbi:MAG: TonB-dependent receptor [Saprospiraceae bacterium]